MAIIGKEMALDEVPVQKMRKKLYQQKNDKIM